jgi:acyl-CoA reductase-like NAD-dependent aldehyde dehydrogenase
MNPVAGPYFNISTNQPTGVVAAFAPQTSSLVGLVNTIAPVIVTGNAIVVVASESLPLSAITLTEVLATSDLPGGVVNVLTGKESEMAPWLASHQDVNALDLEGTSDPVDLEIRGAETLKRVVRPGTFSRTGSKGSLQQILAFMEIKTVWHPKGH